MVRAAGQKGQLAKGSIPRKMSRICFPTYQQMVSKLGNLKRSAVLNRFSISQALEEVGTTITMITRTLFTGHLLCIRYCSGRSVSIISNPHNYPLRPYFMGQETWAQRLCDLTKFTELLSEEEVFIFRLNIIRNQYPFLSDHLASFQAALLTIAENSRTLADGNGQLGITRASGLT